MKSTLFLHSAMQDPYQLYQLMLAGYPVYWDETNQLWGIYSYDACQSILLNENAHIPVINANNKQLLNDYALLISNQLARLSNGIDHLITRWVATRLYENMQRVDLAGMLQQLLAGDTTCNGTNWVNTVCKKLPVLVILKSLGFTEKDTAVIAQNIATLATITLPQKTPEQVNSINAISKEIYQLVESHLLRSGLYKAISMCKGEKYIARPDILLSTSVSNCIGLFIQSYDAGRGLLSNALLQLLRNKTAHTINREFISKSVTETLRFDPPVHNTRRVAAHDIVLNGITIKQGSALLIVLAAANRDPLQFNEPNKYNIERSNNHEHLTFGRGAHMCIAKHFAVNITIESMNFLFSRFKRIQLVEETIQYEPLVNARIPVSMQIALSTS